MVFELISLDRKSYRSDRMRLACTVYLKQQLALLLPGLIISVRQVLVFAQVS